MLRPGERSAEAGAEYARAARVGASDLTHGLRESALNLNREVMQVTQGRLDLSSLTGLGILAAGATEVLVTRRLPAPPWFDLAWWAFRTSTIFGDGPESSSAPSGEVPSDA